MSKLLIQPEGDGHRPDNFKGSDYNIPLRSLLGSDFSANRRNPKGMLLCFLYRVAHSTLRWPKYTKLIQYFVIVIYKLITEYILGSEIHWRANIGPRLRVFHGYNIVVHSGAVIGKNCILRHGVTIGAKDEAGLLVPTIGDSVEFGVGVIVIGKIIIGNNVKIGAGSVVVKDISEGEVVAGNPARVLGNGK